jgi:hypothetical protein
MTSVARTLSTGIDTNKKVNGFASISYLVGRTKSPPGFFVMTAAQDKTIVAMLIVVSKGKVINGSVNPKMGSISFTTNPRKIKNARLRPEEKSMISVRDISRYRSIVRRVKPGRNVRYTNPITWRSTMMFRSTAVHIAICASMERTSSLGSAVPIIRHHSSSLR